MDKTDQAVSEVINKLQAGFSAIPWSEAGAVAIKAIWLQAVIGLALHGLFVVLTFIALIWWGRRLWASTENWDKDHANDDGPPRIVVRFAGWMPFGGIWFIIATNLLFYQVTAWVTAINPMAGLALKIINTTLK